MVVKIGKSTVKAKSRSSRFTRVQLGSANVTPIEQFVVDVQPNDINMGTVSGSGRYRKGSVITISATPNYGYEFSYWSDGSHERERQITVTSDISLTAFFKAQEHRGILTYVPNKEYVNPQS